MRPYIFFYKHSMDVHTIRGLSQESIIFIAFIITAISFLGTFTLFIQGYKENNLYLDNKNNIEIVSAKEFIANGYIYKIFINIKINEQIGVIPERIVLLLPNKLKISCNKSNLMLIAKDLYACVSSKNFKSAVVEYNGTKYEFYVYINELNELVVIETIYRNGLNRYIIFKGFDGAARSNTNRTISYLIKQMVFNELPLYHYIIAKPILLINEINISAIFIYILLPPIPIVDFKYINLNIFYRDNVMKYRLIPSRHIDDNVIAMVIKNG